MQEMTEGDPKELELRGSLAERRAQVANISGDADGRLTHLSAAFAAQKQLVLALRGDYEDAQADGRHRAAALAARVASLHEAASRLGDARAVYAGLLTACPDLPDAALAVARLDLRLGDPASCEQRVRRPCLTWPCCCHCPSTEHVS